MPLPIYLMSNFPSVRPSLNLQFDSQPTPEDMTNHLNSVGATFSRASTGTYTDANGLIQEASAGQARPNYSSAGVHEGLLIEESRTNLVTSSEGDFIDWNTAGGASFTSFSAIAPDGTYSAGTLVVPSSGARLENSSISVPNGEHTYSVYLKSSSGSFSIDIRLMTGTTVTVTDEWQRFTVTETVSSFSKIQIRAISATGNQTLYVWGAQVEAGSFPTSYIPTIPTFSSRASTATYFDSSGVLQTASIDEARTDHKYIDGQWVEAGLLLEASATNYIQNQDITTWGKDSGTVVSAESSDSKFPDLDIYSIEDGGGGGDRVYEAFNQKTYYSVFVKRKTGTPNVRLQQTSGNVVTYDLTNVTTNSANGEIVDVGDGWFRLLHEDTGSGNGTYQIDLDNQSVGDAVYVTGIQAEDNRWTSFIPIVGGVDTDRSADVYTTATKTRSTDVCYIDGTAFTDFYNQEQGTTFVNAMCEADSGASRFIYEFSNGTSSERMYGFLTSSDAISNNVISSGSGQAPFTGSAVTLGTFFKTSYRYNTNSFNQVTDGTASTPDTSGNVSTPDRIYIGATDTPSAFFNGYIKKFIYFPKALSDNELIKLTQ